MTSPPDCRTPPLLHLTPHIRRRIYRFVGLASWDRRNPYRFDLHGRPASSDAPDPSSFHGLLLSCRAIHAEAAALLYSANWFVLYYSHADPASLRPLHALTAPSLRSLSNLKIILNEASCHQLTMYPEGCCLHGYDDDHMYGMYQCKRRHGGLHQLPLLSPASEGSDHGKLAATQAATMLGEWCTAAARLSQVAPGRLALSLVCDIDPQHPQALHVVESAVAPIRLLPPSHLRECHIRLAKTPDSRLQQVARDTVLHACGIPTPSSKPSNATTLTTLPRELRIRILEHTDLVTPRREVTWSRQEDHGYVVFNRGYDGDSTPDECHSAQFFKCWLGKSYVGGPPTNGCFCRRRHAAFSLTCKCWAPPGPALFLVCRALCEDARFVFFSSNRFIVHDFKTSPPWGLPLLDECPEEEPVPTCPYPNARLAASQFLREVVPARSLAHLRFLELVFPITVLPAGPRHNTLRCRTGGQRSTGSEARSTRPG